MFDFFFDRSIEKRHPSFDSEATVEANSVTKNDADVTSVDEEVSPMDLRKIYWKIDLRIIPALWVLYFLSSYGSSAYGNAQTMNYEEGHSIPLYLNLTSHEQSLATTLDYVAYIVFDVPMNLCFTVFTPRAWLSRIIISIGVVYACIAAVKNAAGIQAIRFFTGLVTAGIWPGMTYYVSAFYPVEMLSQRIGYYYTAAQISAAVAGLLGAAFQKMDSDRGYTGYQWNFLIYGVVTIAIGILLYFWLPNRPKGQKIWPLTDRDVRIHQRDIAGRPQAHQIWNWRDLFRVAFDIRIYPPVIMYFGVVGTGIAIQNYATTILKSINSEWSGITLSLLTAPIWLFDLGGILVITPFADKWPQHRGLIFSISTAIIIVGLFVTTYAPDGWSRWGGLLICGFGLGPTVPITMSWGASIFYRFHGDLGVAMSAAIISGLGNCGSVTTTYALYSGWPEDAATGYRDSNMVMVSILGISIIAAAINTLLQYFMGDFGDYSLLDVTFLNWFRGRSAKDHVSHK